MVGSRLVALSCALGLVGLDTILKALLVPASAGNFRLMTFYPAVILGWDRRLWPGAHAILASVTSAGLLAPPADSFRVASPHDIAALILFSAVGILMATVSRRYAARRRGSRSSRTTARRSPPSGRC